jgi:hypothetical protein
MGDIVLARLADLLGPIEVIATGPPRSPLPATGHCSRCGSSTTRYGPAGSPLCDRCQDSGTSRAVETAKGAGSV